MLVPPTATVVVPKLTYSESWTEKVVKYKDPATGDVWYDMVPSGKFQINVTLPAFLVDTKDIGADTEFSVAIGTYADSFHPGEDPKYIPGQSYTANITRSYDDGNGHNVTYVKATLKWTGKTVSLAISGIAPNDYITDTPTEGNYWGLPGPIQDTQEAGVNITTPAAGYNHTFSVNLTGNNAMKSVTTPDGSTWDLNNISLKGSASGF
jgi:hypothetical protein